jgi:phosphatidylglycerophosphate synthase
MVLLARVAPSPPAFAVCLATAFLSDVFDGIAARRLGVATTALRRLDSAADTVFYVAAAYAAWELYPEAVSRHAAAHPRHPRGGALCDRSGEVSA